MIYFLYMTLATGFGMVIYADCFLGFVKNKTRFIDLGLGIAVASSTILIFLTIKRVKSFRDIKTLTSLGKRQAFVYFNIAWFSLFPNI